MKVQEQPRVTFACSRSTIETLENGQWRHSGFFITNFDYILHLFLVSLLLTLNEQMLIGTSHKVNKYLEKNFE